APRAHRRRVRRRQRRRMLERADGLCIGALLRPPLSIPERRTNMPLRPAAQAALASAIVAVLLGSPCRAGVQPAAQAATATPVEKLTLSGKVKVNGTSVVVSSSGQFDRSTGSYQIVAVAPAGNTLSQRERFLLSLIPRVAFAFLPAENRPALLDNSGPSGLSI